MQPVLATAQIEHVGDEPRGRADAVTRLAFSTNCTKPGHVFAPFRRIGQRMLYRVYQRRHEHSDA